MKTYKVKTEVSFPLVNLSIVKESEYTIGESKEPLVNETRKTVVPPPAVEKKIRRPPIAITSANQSTQNHGLYESNPVWRGFTSSLNSFLNEIRRHPVLTREQIYHLIEIAQLGDLAARNVIVLHNQKLILKIVNSYKKSDFF